MGSFRKGCSWHAHPIRQRARSGHDDANAYKTEAGRQGATQCGAVHESCGFYIFEKEGGVVHSRGARWQKWASKKRDGPKKKGNEEKKKEKRRRKRKQYEIKVRCSGVESKIKANANRGLEGQSNRRLIPSGERFANGRRAELTTQDEPNGGMTTRSAVYRGTRVRARVY